MKSDIPKICIALGVLLNQNNPYHVKDIWKMVFDRHLIFKTLSTK